MNKKILLILLVISITVASCFKDNDDEIQVASTIDIQNFIYRGLNFFYLYKQIPLNSQMMLLLQKAISITS